MVIQHSKHVPHIEDDYIVICNWNYVEATALQVLEEATDEHIGNLGQIPKTVKPEQLWLSLSYQGMRERAHDMHSLYALRKALEDLELRGWVETRYVRQNSDLVIYQNYEEAQADKSHTGEIIKQYRFRFDLVQAEIDRRFPESELPHEGVTKSRERSSLSGCSNSTTNPLTNSTGEVGK